MQGVLATLLNVFFSSGFEGLFQLRLCHCKCVFQVSFGGCVSGITDTCWRQDELYFVALLWGIAWRFDSCAMPEDPGQCSDILCYH